MKKKLPKAKFVMYQWDSMEQSHYNSIIKYFDKVKTFDMSDSKIYNLNYHRFNSKSILISWPNLINDDVLFDVL